MVRALKGEVPPVQARTFTHPTAKVKGLNGERIAAILKDHGIDKSYSSMGGRTTRASTPDAQKISWPVCQLSRDSPPTSTPRSAMKF